MFIEAGGIFGDNVVSDVEDGLESQIVKIAKRENNGKRNYLVVNPLQGKHVPVSPQKALDVFSELAKLLKVYGSERILIVGFAETATAIGAYVAIETGANYIHTTREDMGNASCFCFSEEHSHATEQKLVRDDIDKMIDDIDRIVFVEDEITTGKTILNIISAIEQCYQCESDSHLMKNGLPWKIKFSVASILNGMSNEAMKVYKSKNINVHYLVKIEHTKYPQIADSMVNDGVYYSKNVSEAEYTACFEIAGAIDTRRVTDSAEYAAACEALFDEISRCIPLSKSEKILILGTEEFMFPGLYVGKCLRDAGHIVRFHATTRSPISVSQNKWYPLHKRYELSSFYEKERKTFVYDIASYDAVIVITDAQTAVGEGAYSLLHAVRQNNEKVYLVRWRRQEGK